MDATLTTFRFGMPGRTDEDFIARTSDPAVIAEARAQLARPELERNLHPIGRIQRVPRGENLEWTWQHLPSEWTLAEVSAELCDAEPSYVQEHLDEWLRDVGRFCPWTCRVKAEERP